MESTRNPECEHCDDDGYVIVTLPPGYDYWRPNLSVRFSKTCEHCKGMEGAD